MDSHTPVRIVPESSTRAKPNEPRYPLAPVTARFGVLELGRLFGYTPKTVRRWAATGIPELHADRIAVRLFHCHPGDLWPDYWTHPTLEETE